jgi:hypothetical protein
VRHFGADSLPVTRSLRSTGEQEIVAVLIELLAAPGRAAH